MPENKKETNLDVVRTLNDFKKDKLSVLSGEISREKSKAAVLIATIKAKRDALNAKLEEEARLKQEQEAALAKANASTAKSESAPAVAKKEEPKKQEKDAKVVSKPEQGAKEAKQASKPQVEAKTPFEQVIVSEDGAVRRVYVPPTPTAKPKVQTRVFGGGGYQQPRQPRLQGGTRQQGVGGMPRRPLDSRMPAVAPQPFPPTKPNGQKGKGGKPNGANNSNKFDDRTMNKRALLKKGYIVDDRISYDEDGEIVVRNYKVNRNREGGNSSTVVIENAVITTDPVSIKTLSEKIGKSAAEIVKTLFVLGIMKTINDSIDFATAELVADEFHITLEYKPEVTLEDTLTAQLEVDDVEDLDNLVSRPPIITIMGHVDHGKTSLLDYIRKTQVTKGEAGGITQHIGAYTITLNGSPITFLDTPGHEAFTSMRARGAQVTDIAILVVAADDGIMPQTIEAISHAKQAKVPIIVAVNKIDKAGANPDRVLQQLTEHDITPEQWGGETPVVNVSAKTGQGVEELLEQILVRAEFEELRANPKRNAHGTIIEAKLDKGLGKIATILVQTGTLHVGDNVVAGVCTGKIRAMIDDKGRKVKTAGPSMPVSVTGWDDVPEAGDRIDVVADEKFARELAEERKLKLASSQQQSTAVSLNDLFDKISKGELKSVKLIIKADVQGSVEAVKQSLAKLGNEEVTIDIIHSAVGGIKESDVLLAETAGAIIIGFNVRPDTNAKALASQKKIDIRFYDIIYNAIEDVEKAVKGLLAPKFREVVLGSAEIRRVYKIKGIGAIAGCYVVDGKIARNAKARLIRNGTVEYTGEIASLRHEKDDVKEMARGFECGVTLSNYQDIKEGDVIEAFVMETQNEN
ncbi:MAG: translation initiation factor IF-2 [Bacteroides sp.]|nr:translation initiation factor IF-2 [Bacillota bacterium]MCM1393862.1 translation initiation factor IF-2 [[Eubacterium] siraeum]MCM1455805.1 translation initiation factor IF-2 [Bacteroides sp.]